MCMCVWVFTYAWLCLYTCMNACTHAFAKFPLMFFSMLIYVFGITISQERRALFFLRSLVGSSWWWCVLWEGPYQGRLEWSLHCEASCGEYCCSTTCPSLHCLGMYLSCNHGGFCALFWLWHIFTFCMQIKS